MTLPPVTPFKFLSVALFLVLTGPAGAAEDKQPELSHTLTALSPSAAPDFTLEDIDNKKFSLKDYRGKVVLLNFWATWCPPCRREMPSLTRLHEHLKNKNFVVLGLNQMEDEDQVFAYTGGLELSPAFPILFDKDSSVSSAYKVVGLPTTYIIDKKGNLRFRAVGGRDFDHPDVQKLIQKLMQE